MLRSRVRQNLRQLHLRDEISLVRENLLMPRYPLGQYQAVGLSYRWQYFPPASTIKRNSQIALSGKRFQLVRPAFARTRKSMNKYD
jgi:hypothetical protein